MDNGVVTHKVPLYKEDKESQGQNVEDVINEI